MASVSGAASLSGRVGWRHVRRPPPVSGAPSTSEHLPAGRWHSSSPGSAAAGSGAVTLSERTLDRRFNRARYDADQTVTAFSARLKDVVDLDSVRDDLAGVVQRTLEPSHLSVWVSRPGSR
jgi:hypothetical protein